MFFNFRLFIAKLLLKLIDIIEPKYWRCSHCRILKLKEEEVICWKCGLGEMIYKGR